MERKKHNKDKIAYLTPADVASRLLVSPITVNQWAKKGWLKSYRTGGGHHRFLPADVDLFCQQRNIETANSQQSQRVLIIDADRVNCALLERQLNTLPIPIDICVANDSFTAGRYVERFKPQVVILDLALPELDIVTLCKHLRREISGDTMRIISMTQVLIDAEPSASQNADGNETPPKSIDMAALNKLFVTQNDSAI